MRYETLMITCAAIAANLMAAPLTLKWTSETSNPQPYTATVMRGETVSLAPTLRHYGELLDLTNAEATLYWQTNGMDNAWWSIPATVSGATITGTWTPENDSGADVYSFFLSARTDSGTLYRAYGSLRMRPSPGFNPAELPPPEILSEYATKDWIEAQHFLQDGDVPEWALQPEKPTYTVEEVGAASASDLTAYLRRDGSYLLNAGAWLRALNSGASTGGFVINDSSANLGVNYTALTRIGIIHKKDGVSRNILFNSGTDEDVALKSDLAAITFEEKDPTVPAATNAVMDAVAQTYAPLVSPLFPGTVRANTFIAPLQNNLISKTTMNYQGILVDNNQSGNNFRGTMYANQNIMYYPSYSSSPVYYRFGTGTGTNEKDNIARFVDLYAVTASVLNTVANGYMPIAGPVLNANYIFLNYDNEDYHETKTIDVSDYDSFSVFTSGPNSTSWIVSIICQKPEKIGKKKTIAILPLPDESHNIDLSFALPDSRIFKGTWDGNPVQGSLIKIEMEAIQSVYFSNEPPTLGWAVTVNIQAL